MLIQRFGLHTFNLILICNGSFQLSNAIGLDRLLSAKMIEIENINLPNTRINVDFKDYLLSENSNLSESINQNEIAIIQKIDNRIQSIKYRQYICLEFLKNGESQIYISRKWENIDRDIIDQFLVIALDYAVASNAQSLCHAACILMPDEKSVALVHAASGTGKTTTSMALISRGFKVIGDDACGIYCDPEKLFAEAWGLPRAAKVHKNTVEFIGELHTVFDNENWDAADEQFLDRKAMIASGYMIDKGLLPIRAVISLQRDLSEPTSIDVLDKFGAISSLLNDNLVAIDGEIFPSHQSRLNVFSELVKRTVSYSVNINSSPSHVAEIIDQALKRDAIDTI